MLGCGRLGQSYLNSGFTISGLSYNQTITGYYIANFYGLTFFGSLNIYPYNEIIVDDIINQYKTLLELRHKNGGLKSTWYINQESNNPIEKIELEINKNGSGIGKVNFAYLEIPIEAEDYMIFYIQGKPVYKGFVNNDVELTESIAELYPFSKRLGEWTYSGSFTNKTVSEILETILTSLLTETSIKWTDSYIDIGISDPITIEYQSERVIDIINKLVPLLEDRYWYVDIDNYFHISSIEQTNIKKYLYAVDNALFSSVKIKKDYSKIEATLYRVYQNQEDGTVTYIGNVGDSVGYPAPDITNKLRIIEAKYIAPEIVDITTAKDLAYAELKQKAKVKQSIDVKGIDITRYQPEINDYLLIETDYNNTFETVNDCESITGWYNSVLSSGTGIDNSDCINIFDNTSDTTSYYNAGRQLQYFKQKKISMYIKSSAVGQVIDIGFTNNLLSIAYTRIYIRSSEWEYYSFDYTDSFQFVVFNNTNTETDNIFVDKIQVLCEGKQTYIDNVINIKYNIDDNGIKCNITLGDVIEEEGNDLFELKKKVRILETINAV